MRNKKYLKTKTKSFEDIVSTSFHDDGKPIERSYCICLSVILIESVFKIGKYYYPHVF